MISARKPYASSVLSGASAGSLLPVWWTVRTSSEAVTALWVRQFYRAHDLRAVLRLTAGRAEEPLGSRPLHAAPERGARAARHGHKRTGGGEAAWGLARLGAVAAPLDGRARLRLDGTHPPLGPRLRALARHAGRIAPRRLRRPTPTQSRELRSSPQQALA